MTKIRITKNNLVIGARRGFHYAVVAGVLAFAVYVPVSLQHPTSDVSLLAHAQGLRVTQTKVVSLVKKTVVIAPQPVAQHGATAWSYDFTDKPNGPLSNKDWNFETGVAVSNYNNEQQAYTSATGNIRIQNGMLVIDAKQQAYQGKQYTSARINTLGKFDFTYGTFEVDMMMPSGTGSWPAAWLLPANNIYKPADYGITKYNPYGWALNGEIDFAEAVGYIPGQNIPAIHSYAEVQRAPTYTPAYIPDSASAFHRYGVIKTPTSITFTIDGKPYASRIKTSNNPLDWPYDQPYYVILDLAVGGNWAGAQGIDNASAPWELKIKSMSYTPL